MKKIIAIAAAGVAMSMSLNAQNAVAPTSFGDNWSIGLDGGVTTPLARHHAFFGDMRGQFGLHVQKQISPAFALGVEGVAGVNTSSWNTDYFTTILGNTYSIAPGRSSTAIDNMYVGVYGSVNLMNLFGGYKFDGRFFDIEITAGAGWGHEFFDRMAMLPYSIEAKDQNFLLTKAGINFNFNVTKNLTLSLKPYVAWNMTGSEYLPLDVEQTSAAYSRAKATFNLNAGVTYNFGPGFVPVDTRNQAELDALNKQINDLRAEIAACNAATSAAAANAADLANQLQACKNRKPEVIKEVNNNLQSVRYIFYKIGSSVITADQMPNVEMVASYMKNHKDSKVLVKGYASQDGNLDLNVKLAQARAESVKNALVSKYGIKADRIKAEGEGIGHMFTENDWNRVSICTLD
ncbi:MAG: OmpA family protein [Paramuribaculum sp.]|nr:OmpA family protein [Paramuribaculum sp.]MDE6489423.1 OmpA family protein [Paramuribaculum sp.]